MNTLHGIQSNFASSFERWKQYKSLIGVMLTLLKFGVAEIEIVMLFEVASCGGCQTLVGQSAHTRMSRFDMHTTSNFLSFPTNTDD